MNINKKIQIFLFNFFLFFFLFAFKAQAATEFVCSIMQSNGEYNSLYSWNSAMTNGGIDLTATNTKVFSHSGITGHINDGSSVLGAVSGSTAIAVHVSASQILLKNISGSFQAGEQVKVDASNYVVITDTGDSPILTAKIDGSWSAPETTAAGISLTLQNAATSATNYIRIYTTAAARHNGKWSSSAYTFSPGNYGHLYIYVNYVWIDGLQIVAPTGNSNVVFYSYPPSSASIIRVSNNIMYGGGKGLGLVRLIGTGVTQFWNNLIYDTVSQGVGITLHYNSSTYLYNNTVSGLGIGILAEGAASAFHLKNNLVSGNGADYSGTFANDSANNLSSDGSSQNAQWRNKTVSFVNAANQNFFLSSEDTVAKDQAVDLSSDANLSFINDIAGNSRPNDSAWDIGANEYSASNPNSLPPVKFSITASTNAGGSITPSGQQTFNSGALQRYIIAADQGYVVQSLIVDGVTIQGQGAYTFANLNANHTIEAVFANIESIGTSITNPLIFHPINYSYSPTKTLYVSPSGNDANDCSESNPCRQISHAITLAQSGTLISVADGLYDHFKITSLNGTSDKPIIIKAEGSSAIVDSANTDTDNTRGNIYIHFCSYIIIDGLKTYNGIGALGTGIAVRTSPHITLRNIVSGNNYTWGIYSAYSDYSLFENNEAYGSQTQHGIYVANTTHFSIIRGNLLHNNGMLGLHMNGDMYTDPETDGNGNSLYTGELTYTITNALIENNIFYNNGSGMDMDGGRDSIIKNNIVLNNTSKGIVLFHQDSAQAPANVKVFNNTVIAASGSPYAPLRFTDAQGPIIVRNNIVGTSRLDCSNLIATDMTTNETKQYIDSDYNIWVGSSSGTFGVGGGSCNTNFNAWQSTYGKDGHSQLFPLISNLNFFSQNNFHLLAGSPAIDGGTSLPDDVVQDRDNNFRPQGIKYDIGAYEYLQSYIQSDFISLFSNWLKQSQISDLNNDSIVNAKDLGIMMSKWN